jgi:hypothetical protein
MHMNIELLNKKLENLENKTTNNLNSTPIVNNILINNNISANVSKEE